MNENCILFNDKKIDLTDDKLKEAGITKEQLKKLGIELNDGLEERVLLHHQFYVLFAGNGSFGTERITEFNGLTDEKQWECGNYFSSVEDAEQAALLLNLQLRLMAFKRRNDPVKNVNWRIGSDNKYCIVYDHEDKFFRLGNNQWRQQLGCVYFSSENLAERAIKEVIEPYLKEHPEFIMK
jgi:hypothetical protein